MKVMKLIAENFKCLGAVEIDTHGKSVVVSGRNGAGKSAVLSAIETAIGGKKVAPKTPIKEGQTKAVIVLETEKYIITRKFTPSGTYLEITNTDGFKASSPETLAKSFAGDFTFDPLNFKNKSAKEQRQLIIDMTGLDTSDLDEKIAELTDERKIVNRQIADKTGVINSMVLPAGGKPNRVKVEALLAELVKAEAQNSERIDALRQIDDITNEIARNDERIGKLQTEIEALREANKALEKECKTTQAPAAVDTEPIKQKLRDAEKINADVVKFEAHESAVNDLEFSKAQYKELGEQREAVEAEKRKRTETLKMPVDGLEIVEDGLKYKGRYFDDLNEAKKLEISMAVGMAANPELRIMLTDGNGLDDESLAMVKKMADSQDYQLWIERVAGDKSSIIIRDGAIVDQEADNGPTETDQ